MAAQCKLVTCGYYEKFDVGLQGHDCPVRQSDKKKAKKKNSVGQESDEESPRRHDRELDVGVKWVAAEGEVVCDGGRL